MYNTILFDLDGTLTESAPGITRSVQYALKKYGIDADLKDLDVFVGPPLAESFEKYYGIKDTMQAIEYYREYYEKSGLFDSEVYEGIPFVLEELQKEGKTVILATSKPEQYARQILDHYGLSQYFDGIIGATMDESLVEKPDIIKKALELVPEGKAVMIGDRRHDIEGAKANGIDSIGVLYGYGSLKELEKAGATQIISKPIQILEAAA